ncbi:MAG: tetratricopeptide repeat protein [Acidobacteria bacterium]|nr:tetratricopeptide repeat protein [Acidobacteriota bacterium]
MFFTPPPARPAHRPPETVAPPLLFALLLLALACVPAAGQVGGLDNSGTGGIHTIQGRLVGPSGRRSDLRLKVRLESSGSGDSYVFSDANGTFRFTGLSPGSYTVVVEGGDEFETASETVLIESSTISTPRGVVGTPFSRPLTVQVYLRPKRGGDGQAPAGVLNASLATVPKPAVEFYHKGVEAERRNENERAAELLRQAVDAHPDFPLALYELGITYLKLKHPEKAAEALTASLKLVPEDQASLLAYGRALIELRRVAEAEEQFRKVLKKNAASPSAHLYLGMILLGRREFPGAEAELKAAAGTGAGEVVRAHYYLGGLYWELKEYKRAADELETYLKLSPDAPDAGRLRTTIKELRSK